MAQVQMKSLILILVISSAFSWNLPNLPSGKRSQYFVLHDDGGYKYGYDTGKGAFAKEAGDAHNEVAGHYAYKDGSGQNIDVKYTAGVNGFVPENLEKLLPQQKGPYGPQQGYSYPAPSVPVVPVTHYSYDASSDSQSNTGDASYTFTIDTDTYKREEVSDTKGNIHGRYSYSNDAGHHDLSYIAGSNTGFVATSGSLAVPNGLAGQSPPQQSYSGSYAPSGYAAPVGSAGYSPVAASADGSYAFQYAAGDHSRQESADASGNVQGRYSYTNDAGTHDLSYVAGSQTGFLPTGGSLAAPNGLIGKTNAYSSYPTQYHPSGSPVHAMPAVPVVPYASHAPVVPNSDGSYSFQYATDDSSRQESADASGNVQGRYSYTNKDGQHDLSYVAGAQTGFLPTGGNLAVPNGFSGQSPLSYQAPAASTSYFAPRSDSDVSTDSSDDQANTGDSSYNFSVDTPEYQRHESADTQGNGKGSYSYKNAAGSHDLSYVAGSETGFQATGGSLAVPNGLEGKSVPSESYLPPQTYTATSSDDNQSYSTDDQANTGDASYNFSIDTPEYKRHESSDAQGHVKGSYTYKNVAGSHDLSYEAGSETGFQATGGSLATPNGISGSQAETPVAPTSYLPPQARSQVNLFHSSNSQPAYTESKVGSFHVKQYFPSKSQSKYGYIYESA